jgi:hypothetical protein
MTNQELETVKRLIEEGSLSLNIEMCGEEPRIRLCAALDSHIKPVGIMALQPLISQRIFILADMAENAEEEVEVVRGLLFTLAGRMRELARIAEVQAGRLNPNIANWQTCPSFEPFNDDET